MREAKKVVYICFPSETDESNRSHYGLGSTLYFELNGIKNGRMQEALELTDETKSKMEGTRAIELWCGLLCKGFTPSIATSNVLIRLSCELYVQPFGDSCCMILQLLFCILAQSSLLTFST